MVKLSCLSIFLLLISAVIVNGEGYNTEVRSYKVLSENPSGFIEIIRIDEDPAKSQDISDELKKVSGVQINQTGGIDSFSTIMIRGASSSSVDVFINGVKVNPLTMGSFNLSILPDEIFERIEVYKGFTPLRLGFSNTGGSVNIVTRRSKGENKGLKLYYGSFNTIQSSGFLSDSENESSYFFSFYYRHTDGDYEFLNRNGTFENREDDVIKKRENNQKDEYALSLTATSMVRKDLKLDISLIPSYSSGGIPGPENLETEHSFYNSLTNIFSLTGHLFLRSFINEIVLGYSNLYYRNEFNDRFGELNMLFADITDTSGIRDGIYLLSDLPLYRNYVALKFSYSDESIYRKSRMRAKDRYEGKRGEYVFNIEDNIEVILKKLYIIPSIGIKKVDNSVRYSSMYLMKEDEDNSSNALLKNYRIGIIYRLTDELLFRSNYSVYKRYPDMYEIFGDGVYIFPNPELRPEYAKLFDFGFEFYTDYLFIKYAVFKSDYEDLIQFWQNSQKTIKPENISKAEIYGTELSLNPVFYHNIISELSYTHQEPINKSDIPSFKNKILPFRYTDSLSLKTGILISDFKVLYEYQYTSQNYFDAANFLPEGGTKERSFHNLSLTYFYRKSELNCGLYIKNITDVRTEDIAGYPLPGRMFFVGISKTFNQKKEERYEED